MKEHLHDITDVADWFLNKMSMRHKKLQKLCYYAVAWNYALLEKQLCTRDEFMAWVHGPVNKILFEKYRQFVWSPIPEVTETKYFGEESEEVLERVFETYGDLSGDDLENITHDEPPWKNARGELREHEHSSALIKVEDMIQFYQELYASNQND
jgi:uncharacterized phage-associated protein